MTLADRLYARDVTPDDVRDLIAIGQRELDGLEFKAIADVELLKTACGIANMGGGFILIGIGENADHCAAAAINVENANGVADSLRQKFRDGIAPRPVIEVVPLVVGGVTIVIARVSPQNPPHMVSQGNQTMFYGRYDATTKEMRYEEIEQRFREKHLSGFSQQRLVDTRPTIETIRGRTEVSQSVKDALERYVDRLR